MNQEHKDMQFYAGFDGLNITVIDSGRVYQEYPAMTELLRMTAKVRFNANHPILETFSTGDERTSIPSPACLLSLILTDDVWKSFYLSEEDLSTDIAKAYNKLFLALHSQGCHQMQLNDNVWLQFIDSGRINMLIQSGIDIERIMTLFINVNNAAMAELPRDLSFIEYIGRSGDTEISSLCVPDYSLIAPKLFTESKADKFCIDLAGQDSEENTLPACIPREKLCHAERN